MRAQPAAATAIVLAGALWAPALAVAGLQSNGAPTYECWEQNTERHVEAAGGLTLCSARRATDADPANDYPFPEDGALVVAISPDGIAAVEGLKTGDLLYKVNGARIQDARGAAAGLQDLRPSQDTLVNFLRDGRPYLVRLRQR
jgi:hypothetical protein